MPVPLLTRIIGKVSDQQGPWADQAHIPFQNVKELRQLVQAAGPKQLSKGSKPDLIRQKFSLIVPLIRHGTEFIELKYFLVFPGALLGKQRRLPKLTSHQNPQKQQQR